MLAAGAAVDAMFGYVPSTKSANDKTGGTLDGLTLRGVTDVSILWISDFVRYGPHAVRMSLPREARPGAD
jgi:ABC-type phosphate/phosphonate transport system substrate-binding protein